ncbi:unnamed protein product [Nezara viridula]|uniref:Uncharacterized protein n=1 Tax=Nezara viridula TaxID=85310 RepID=A0A9P0HAU5_NEZVI|nr:unnamed protein product [Nezara viridula]
MGEENQDGTGFYRMDPEEHFIYETRYKMLLLGVSRCWKRLAVSGPIQQLGQVPLTLRAAATPSRLYTTQNLLERWMGFIFKPTVKNEKASTLPFCKDVEVDYLVFCGVLYVDECPVQQLGQTTEHLNLTKA